MYHCESWNTDFLVSKAGDIVVSKADPQQKSMQETKPREILKVWSSSQIDGATRIPFLCINIKRFQSTPHCPFGIALLCTCLYQPHTTELWCFNNFSFKVSLCIYQYVLYTYCILLIFFFWRPACCWTTWWDDSITGPFYCRQDTVDYAPHNPCGVSSDICYQDSWKPVDLSSSIKTMSVLSFLWSPSQHQIVHSWYGPLDFYRRPIQTKKFVWPR